MRAILITESTAQELIELPQVVDTDHALFVEFIDKNYYFIDGYHERGKSKPEPSWVAVPKSFLVENFLYIPPVEESENWFNISWGPTS